MANYAKRAAEDCINELRILLLGADSQLSALTRLLRKDSTSMDAEVKQDLVDAINLAKDVSTIVAESYDATYYEVTGEEKHL